MRFPTKYDHYGYGWLAKITQGYHPGIDYNNGAPYADEGQDVVAISDGAVTYADFNNGWGYHVIVYHSNYQIYSHYAHLMKNLYVREGDQVKESQLIGFLGRTGGDWKPHLHFEIRLTNQPANVYVNGMTSEDVKRNYANPETWIKEKIQQERGIRENNSITNHQNNMLKLIRNIGSDKVYAIGKDGKKHWIFNQETFIIGKEMGLWTGEVEKVQDDPYGEGHALFFVRYLEETKETIQ